MAMGELLYELIDTENPLEAMAAWKIYGDLTKDFRLIMTMENYEKDIYPEGLTNILNQENTDFVPYFQSEKIFFLDDNIMNDMLELPETHIKYDYSIMLDTNYTSYIEDFLNQQNKPNFPQESIYRTIDIMLKNNFNYDYTFYLIENYQNLFLAGEQEFSVTNKSHLALYKNLYHLELFKSIDSQIYLNERKIEFQITPNEAQLKTDHLIKSVYKESNGLKIFIEAHKNIKLLLIGIWQIQFESKASPKNKMKKLINYMVEKVGIYYEREMILAYKYFKNPKSVGMLNKINKGGKQTDLIRKIENIVWDFLVPRVMEFSIAANKKNSYFIPLFLSHDKKLKELIALFKIRGFIFHRETFEFYPIPEINNTRFFEEEGLIKEIEDIQNQDTELRRKEVREYNINTHFEIINVEFDKLAKILNS
ncbi:hypothetical protein [Lysinibacillus capsici]|uniref:hypothetical protein n=1 Tax=Lysinibacillus capsici TaxID=2115968 RepID=UPI0028E942A6|nr:hypothetical protein [Lysinibacillus capsici]MED4552793.1 hypothetical protein [Lysinibacillus capsici]